MLWVAASLLCRTNTDETTVTSRQRVGSDTLLVGLIPSEHIHAKSVGTSHKLTSHLWLNGQTPPRFEWSVRKYALKRFNCSSDNNGPPAPLKDMHLPLDTQTALNMPDACCDKVLSFLEHLLSYNLPTFPQLVTSR